MIHAGIVGATGYAGSELVRLLLSHPEAEVTAISSVSFEGKAISEVYPAYFNLCDMVCETAGQVVDKCDVVFAALPHGLSQELAKACDEKGKAFIDLGADFRLDSEEEYQKWYGGTYQDKELHEKAVYGLPELFRKDILGKRVIANPGCYTTGAPLALAPAVANGLIEPDGMNADIHNIKYSNFCDISLHIDTRCGNLIAISAIDNMVKGAAGQAIQNMNLIFGLEEASGLALVPPAF